MFISILYVVLSLVLLFFGAEWLVRGSASLAARLGISALVIGLTVVAIGTSMPELVVSINAALSGSSAIAVGNVIGSNIFNVGAILGISAIIVPLKVQMQLLRWDVPWVIGATVLFLLFFLDMTIHRWQGIIFVVLLAIYIVWNVRMAKREPNTAEADDVTVSRSWVIDMLLVLAGVGLLIVGSKLLVEGAVTLARLWGMSEAVIGLTIVAFGTSVPELATSVVAAVRGKADIAIGNIVGSNLFNILSILGISSIIMPISAPTISWIDLGAMTLLTVMLFPLMKSGFVISRREGFLLLFVYVAYMTYLLVS